MISWHGYRDWPLMGRPSALGLLLGAVFLAASLTPSMIPRSGPLQGVLGGLCFATGYLIGWVLQVLREWVFEPAPLAARTRKAALRWAVLLSVMVVAVALWNVTRWQNDLHEVMGMPPVESARPFTILAVALLVSAVLVLIGRLFRRVWRVASAQLEPFVPRRLAMTIGVAMAVALFWLIGNDVMLNRVMTALDRSYAALDSLIPAETAAPTDPLKSGSPQSLVDWAGLGAEGRSWVLAGPDAAAISRVTGRPALEPLRIYVGLNNAEDPEERARLALAEAIRTGAFARKTLVIATPTGTGWMDPAAMQPLDYLTEGDVAVVGVQYSYLPSWLSLFVVPELGADTARAVYRAFYTHWHALPEDSRPRLYLFGLSLGAHNGQSAATLPELIADPPQGAFWVGPPFASAEWRTIKAERKPGSPVWAPAIGDGAVMRSMTADLDPDRPGPVPWGAVRMLYLTYPSDPIAYFDTSVVWSQPRWLEAPRGRDVSPSLRWFPVVTALQMGFDMMTATSTPPGHGHVYAARDYLTGWHAVLAPEGWDRALLTRLTSVLEAQGL